jgi:hypothetical protein
MLEIIIGILIIASGMVIIINLCGEELSIDYWNLDGEEGAPSPPSAFDFLRTTAVRVAAFVVMFSCIAAVYFLWFRA